MATKVKHLKITAVGDGYVGKTCLLIAYTTNSFPGEYVPTVFENYASNLVIDDTEYNVALWDTAGQEDYERLRPLSYPNTSCFILCFAVNSRPSYDNIKTKWWPEIRHHMPSVPIVLVATKTDLRNDPTIDVISTSEGKRMKDKIKAARYMECSAKNMEGLSEIFIEAVKCSVQGYKSKRQVTCCLL